MLPLVLHNIVLSQSFIYYSRTLYLMHSLKNWLKGNKTVSIIIIVFLIFIGVSWSNLYTLRNDLNLTSEEIVACKQRNNYFMDNPIEKILTLKQTVHKVTKNTYFVRSYTVLGLPFSTVEVVHLGDSHPSCEEYNYCYEATRRIMLFGASY